MSTLFLIEVQIFFNVITDSLKSIVQYVTHVLGISYQCITLLFLSQLVAYK